MALIYRVAAKAAKESMQTKVPINDVLNRINWEIPNQVQEPEDATAKELAEWVRNAAVPKK